MNFTIFHEFHETKMLKPTPRHLANLPVRVSRGMQEVALPELLTDYPITKPKLIRLLETELGRYLPDPTFYRWLKAAGLRPASQYSARDHVKLRFLGSQLRDDRHLERASSALATALVESPDWFPEADGTYFSESTTINIEVIAS
jgi:hypothetical protein